MQHNSKHSTPAPICYTWGQRQYRVLHAGESFRDLADTLGIAQIKETLAHIALAYAIHAPYPAAQKDIHLEIIEHLYTWFHHLEQNTIEIISCGTTAQNDRPKRP